jgi:hypothetical protein
MHCSSGSLDRSLGCLSIAVQMLFTFLNNSSRRNFVNANPKDHNLTSCYIVLRRAGEMYVSKVTKAQGQRQAHVSHMHVYV